MEKCPVCGMPASLGPYNGGCFRFDCLRCGKFSITTEAHEFLKAAPIEPAQFSAASGYIHGNQGLTLMEKDLATLRGIRMPTVDAKAGRLLLALAREYPQPATTIPDPVPRIAHAVNMLAQHSDKTTFPDNAVPEHAVFLKWLAIAWAADAGELRWLFKDVLAAHSLIEFTQKQEIFDARTYSRVVITARGWTEIDRMRSANPQSAVAFVAMSFQRQLTDLYAMGIAPGVSAAGFEPLRVDQKEHNNRIDDEIIASIRSSRFLVADFTVDRGGIYFEAGYALGFGLPVIWLVRDSEKDNIHFDNRQYNFIRWEPENYAALQNALKNRIEATIGRGPLKQTEPRLRDSD